MKIDESTAKIEIHSFITERWSEFCNQLIESGFNDEAVYSEDLDNLIDEILLDLK